MGTDQTLTPLCAVLVEKTPVFFVVSFFVKWCKERGRHGKGQHGTDDGSEGVSPERRSERERPARNGWGVFAKFNFLGIPSTLSTMVLRGSEKSRHNGHEAVH